LISVLNAQKNFKSNKHTDKSCNIKFEKNRKTNISGNNINYSNTDSNIREVISFFNDMKINKGYNMSKCRNLIEKIKIDKLRSIHLKNSKNAPNFSNKIKSNKLITNNSVNENRIKSEYEIRPYNSTTRNSNKPNLTFDLKNKNNYLEKEYNFLDNKYKRSLMLYEKIFN